MSRQDKYNRARELRALGITYKEVSRRLALEGIHYGPRHLATICRDVPCPQLKGRPRLYTPEEAARRAAESRRLSKVRHRERLNRQAREERANETPIERAYRLELKAIYRQRYKQRKARRQLLTTLQIRVARLRSIGYGQHG
ncbi:MAG: hypothetical protein ACPF8W_04550 [Luminiphilus sp.]